MSQSNQQNTPAETLNALIYTSIQNNIPQSDPRFNKLVTKLGLTSGEANVVSNQIDNILSETTLKRACCIANQKGPNYSNQSADGKYIGIDVKIPTPPNYEYSNDSMGSTQKKFGYINTKMYIPKEMCNQVGIDLTNPNNNVDSCNKFFGAYCENQKYFYNLENSGEYNANEFFNYSNYECPCYADYPPRFFSDPGAENGGGVCYLPNCALDTGGQLVYFDPASQAVNNVCTANICSQINTTVAAEAMGQGTINISSENTMKCGIQAPTKKTQSSATIQEQTTAEKVVSEQSNSSNTQSGDKNGQITQNISGSNQGTTTTTSQNTGSYQNTSQNGTGTSPPTTISSTTGTGISKTTTNTVSPATANLSTTDTSGGGNTQSETATGTSNKKWYIIGGVIGGVVLLIISIIFAIMMSRSSNRRSRYSGYSR